MKNYLLLISFFSLLFISSTLYSQTASDYFLPITVGNYLNLRTNTVPQGESWGTRTTSYYFDQRVFIKGYYYVRSVGCEMMDNDPQDTLPFQVLWLRQDSVGNILCGAYIMTGRSTELDSATIIYPAFAWFPNEYLHAGYSRFVGSQFNKDSVISITESVTTLAGPFSNCIEVCSMNLDSLGRVTLRDYAWYAKGVGIVYESRDIPANEMHTAELSSFRAVTSVNDKMPLNVPIAFALQQNYPNPFNPSTTINYSTTKPGNVKLSVYDITGSKVATIVNENKPAGNYSVQFNGANLASGIYLYRLESGSYSASKKFILMK